MDLALIIGAVRPVHGGVGHLPLWGASVFWACGDSVGGDVLGVALWVVRLLSLLGDGGRCGARSVDRDVNPLRGFLASAGGIV